MPAAAAISWVLKDGTPPPWPPSWLDRLMWCISLGLGCLGMMLVAGAFGKFFDTETKRIRWAADCIHVAGVAVRTPRLPFL